MAKQKLTKDQNLQLIGLDLAQKRELLTKWFKNGEVNKEQFYFFSNRWINKKTKQALQQNPLKRHKDENFERRCTKSVTEIEMELLINVLRNRINKYVTTRHPEPLNSDELNKFIAYVTHYAVYRSLTNQLIVLGLRFPDKKLNAFCNEWIAANKMDNQNPDFYFWSLLWEDGNLVPMDAVRLMLNEEDDEQVINSSFNKHLIEALIPMIEIQRNKEKQRLKWAQASNQTEVARKTRRLNAFDILLSAAAEYVRK